MQSGQTALMIAALRGRLEVMDVLLKHNARLDVKDNVGFV